jgi:transposase
MIPISYEEQIVPGTFEHAIDYIIDNRIDVTSLSEHLCNDETGAPAYPPGLLLKIVLLAYARGINTSRKIQALCQENIVFMALSGGHTPDFTTIASFIRSLESEIITIFKEVLLTCDELNLLGGTEFAIDGCKMPSNASKEYSGTFSDLRKKKEKLEKTISFLVKKHKDSDDKNHSSTENEKRNKQIEKIIKKSKKIKEFLRSNKPKSKSRKGERQSNITDNESAKMKLYGLTRLCEKC